MVLDSKDTSSWWYGRLLVKPSEQLAETTRAKLDPFVQFVVSHVRGVVELASVRAEHVRAFLESAEKREVSPRIWNIMLGLLKGDFRRLELIRKWTRDDELAL